MTGVFTMVAMCAGPESGVSTAVARANNANNCGSVSLPTWSMSGTLTCLEISAAISRSMAAGPPHKITCMPCFRTACSATAA
jgi:hypothetical protein